MQTSISNKLKQVFYFNLIQIINSIHLNVKRI